VTAFEAYEEPMPSASASSLYRFGPAFMAMLVGLLWAETSTADSSGTLRISGRVPPQAGIRFSQPSALLSFGGISAANGRLRLADLGIFGNTRQFVVSLASLNAGNTGTPSLVDPETGKALPYALTFGGEKITFVGGEAKIATGANAGDPLSGLKPIELGLAKNAGLNTGRYQEHLVVVVAGR
jgi:hypothetical protein